MKKLYSIIIAFILVFNTTIVFKSKQAQASSHVSTDLPGDISDHNTSSYYYNDPVLYQTNHYATYYYKNLNTNFGLNEKGSCTYVAFAMLLSYYDTFWNDSIIPENYDMVSMLPANQLTTQNESPGVYTESRAIVPIGISTEDYYQVIQQYSSAHLHLKLIQIGKEKFGQYKFSSSSSPCALTLGELQELVNYYLYEYMQFTSSQISYTTATSNVRDFTIQKVKQGIPVLIRMGNLMSGHAFIAYDYDETTDELYGHYGWQTQSHEHIKISTSAYPNYWDATVLNVNMPHSCSDNYKYSSNNNLPSVTRCPCEFSFHPVHHEHSYTANYTSIDSANHIAFCSCGVSIVENHNYTIDCQFETETTHTAYCACGASGSSNHRYTARYVRIDGLSHWGYCACGERKSGGHYISNGAKPPYMCMYCRGQADMGYTQMDIIPIGAVYITANGTYVLPNGIVIVAEADLNDFLNQTPKLLQDTLVVA